MTSVQPTPTENGHARGKRLRAQRIVTAARDLLHENPAVSPTIPDIAARAGVSPMTVFNLIGTRDDLWAALANESLAGWQDAVKDMSDPRKRALKIVEEVMSIVGAEAPVWRALISGWKDSGRVLQREPSKAIIDALQQASEEGLLAPDADTRKLGAMIFSGLVGIVHQWAAGLLSDRAMQRRARDLVDIAFAAGRPDSSPAQWSR